MEWGCCKMTKIWSFCNSPFILPAHKVHFNKKNKQNADQNFGTGYAFNLL